jgi:hypothetical protein
MLCKTADDCNATQGTMPCVQLPVTKKIIKIRSYNNRIVIIGKEILHEIIFIRAWAVTAGNRNIKQP